MRSILREPALVLGTVASVLSLVVAMGGPVDEAQAPLIIAAINALFGVAAAFATRPVQPAVFVGLVTAAAALLAGYGVEVPGDVVAAVNGVVMAVVPLLTRMQVSPASEAPAAP
ncbi:MAG: hypothetical protein ACRDT8_00295 [Micromonosporaceae bacterium]